MYSPFVPLQSFCPFLSAARFYGIQINLSSWQSYGKYVSTFTVRSSTETAYTHYLNGIIYDIMQNQVENEMKRDNIKPGRKTRKNTRMKDVEQANKPKAKNRKQNAQIDCP